MAKINIHDAKTRLSRMVEEVESGKEIVIARAGKPVARLVPFKLKGAPRRKGLLKGKIKISDAFYKPLPRDVIAAFEGKLPE